jgi:hypothetical protein
MDKPTKQIRMLTYWVGYVYTNINTIYLIHYSCSTPKRVARRPNKMFDKLTALGYGIVVFAIIIGVGSIVLTNFGNATGGTSNTTVQYLLTQLGTTGLAGWTPAVIAVSVGLLFLGAFMIGKGPGRR